MAIRVTLMISIVAVIFSLFGQYLMHKQPCQLCIISRFIYIVIIAFGLIKKFRQLVFPIVFFGVIFGMYHLGVENHWWAAPDGCASQVPSKEDLLRMSNSEIFSSSKPSCDSINWEIFGISSTLLNFLLFSFLFWINSIGFAVSFVMRRSL